MGSNLMFFFEEDFNSFLLQGGSCTINNGKITLAGKDQASVDKMKTKVDQNITDMHLYLKKRILYLTYEEYRLCEANIRDLCTYNQINIAWSNDHLILYCFKVDILKKINSEIKANIYGWCISAKRRNDDSGAKKKQTFMSSVKLSDIDVNGTRTNWIDSNNKGARPKNSASLTTQNSTPRNSSNSAQTFRTMEGVQVKVYEADIITTQVDCIVNAANKDLHHAGGIAKTISEAAGAKFDKDSHAYVKINGRLAVGQVCCTLAGLLPYSKVIHAVGPEWCNPSSKVSTSFIL